MTNHLKQGNGNGAEMIQKMVFLLWRIWKARNDSMFKGIKWSPQEVVRKADFDEAELKLLIEDTVYNDRL